MPDHNRAKAELPPIPAKRYFTIGEVSDLCAVKPHVLRYWEQEFTQLKPVKRRGNRRYYQHHEVLLIRRIRDLLYEQGFTINGARHRLESDIDAPPPAAPSRDWLVASGGMSGGVDTRARPDQATGKGPDTAEIRQALEEIRQLLGLDS
jgi:DNA-binding transcriptional MerR regulator